MRGVIMKLKKAKKIARRLGFKYIAVDSNLNIHAYMTCSIKDKYQWVTANTFSMLGTYTGSKDWEDTRRTA